MSRAWCVVTASEAEFRAVASLFRKPAITTEDGLKIARCDKFVLLKSGIGAIGFAARFSAHLSSNDYDAALITGFAGALDPRLGKLKTVVYDRCRCGDDVVDCDSALSTEIAEAVAGSRGMGLTVAKVISEASEKQRLWELYGALAVDMESHPVLAVCARHGLPATALRVISDEAGEDLPDFNRAIGPDGNVLGSRMPAVLIARPAAAWRFLTSMGPAMNALKEALSAATGGSSSRAV
jgi:nucleoside phosphorylase